ncbi:penicillin-binding protein 2 [Nakamurella sp. PAMC28650]|uniref:peptidoglycan D,D-transpeptidase FtsI family protein n=1 Tax=Nakamurella sp. PAMC28650 TaxID=2762325 RepID=UPI00164DAC88|nr:penicillin-binding protein 2 [Nakamurella sp. PAMC28650]QNK82054.1 penicillin-binding protein 2 [Nakamurella sp. PAMC28650]
MKRPLRRVGTAITVLVVLLLANITYIQVVKASAYRADPNNPRTAQAEYTQPRGQITTAKGTVLAQSVPSNDNFKYQRKYPLGATYGAVTGYFSSLYGATGIEQSQSSILSGSDDTLIGNRFSDLLTGRAPQGGNVQLSIVDAVQQAAYNGLKDKNYVGAVVAIAPSTGAILALATSPSYDPTPLASHLQAVQKAESKRINSSIPSVRLNRATAAVYPPGSTFKLIVSGAALQNGYTPTSSVPGVSKMTLPGGGATLSNFDNETCGTGGGADVTLTEALAHSCNTAFATVGIALGADPLKAQAAALGVDPAGFNVGIPVVGSRVGAMIDGAAVGQSSIGQRDVAFTPMQDAVIAATIANHGKRMAPYLVDKTTKPDFSLINQTSPTMVNQSMPTAVADQVRDMMIQSEKDTSGANPFQGVVIASKTGTAEHGTDPKNTPPDCWYVAFAPANNPQVAVAVLVENGGDLGLKATGGAVAGPIGRAVISAALTSQ